MKSKQNTATRTAIRNYLVEILMYGALLAPYIYLAVRYLRVPLQGIYENNLPLYAFLGIVLIAIQSIVLDYVAAFIVDLLGLKRIGN